VKTARRRKIRRDRGKAKAWAGAAVGRPAECDGFCRTSSRSGAFRNATGCVRLSAPHLGSTIDRPPRDRRPTGHTFTHQPRRARRTPVRTDERKSLEQLACATRAS
jgi:hypothetical protein